MIKAIVEISEKAAHLRVRRKQLEILDGAELQGTIPCEDLGVLIVDHPGVTYTHHALMTLASAGTVVLLCDAAHQPVATLLPTSDHCQIVTRLSLQIATSLPTKKRLWKQIVQAKILGQAGNLPEGTPARNRLVQLANEVRPGDPANTEGQAARIYWQNWLNELPAEIEFRRERYGFAPNNFLNYGYAVIRAALARSIVAAGLHPAIGIQHSHRSNAFCLADDLIEPLRPLVDETARSLFSAGHDELNRYTKSAFLEQLTTSFTTPQGTSPMLVAMNRYVSSLIHCLEGVNKFLEIPTACKSQDTETCGLS